MAGGLLTDLYELNMAASYLRRAMTGQATFSLFARRSRRAVGSWSRPGWRTAWQFLESFSFTSDDLAYLRRTQDYGEDDAGAFAPAAVHRRSVGGAGGHASCSPASRCWR